MLLFKDLGVYPKAAAAASLQNWLLESSTEIAYGVKKRGCFFFKLHFS